MSQHEPGLLPQPTPPLTTPITAPRRYPTAPLVGVGVAVFNDRGDVLLVRRGKPPGKDRWSLPGGLIDLGERLEAAARREVMEETGVTIEVGDLITTFEPIERDAAGRVEYHYVVLDFWGRHVAGEPAAYDDAQAVAWVPVGDLAGYAVTAEVAAVVHKGHTAWRAAQP